MTTLPANLRRAKVEVVRRNKGQHYVTVGAIRCATAGCTEWVEFTQVSANHLPMEAFAQFARNRGWKWSNAGAHQCPAHQRKRAPQEVEVKDDHDAQTVKLAKSLGNLPLAAAALPPREPTPADNRRVMDALDSAFDEKIGRYVDVGGSDATLATKLGVPRKWVEDVREKFFGPIKTDPEREKLLADLAALRASVKTAIDKAMNAASEAEGQLIKIDALADRFIKAGDKRHA